MNDEARIAARGQALRRLYEEEGGVGEILQALSTEYLNRLSAVEPWETDKLAKLAIARKVVEQVDNALKAIMADGVVADRARESARKIEAIPIRRRRWADALGG